LVIIQDTREQKPLKFSHPFITEIRVEKLDIGDYACEFKDGHRPAVVFERKSIGDLYGTMGKGYKRFKKIITRTRERKASLFIIVEGSLTKVLRGFDRSQMQGTSMVLKLFTLWLRYGVQTIFCGDRKEMSLFITNFYISAGKEYVRRNGCIT